MFMAGSIRLIALVLHGKRSLKGTLPYGLVREIMEMKRLRFPTEQAGGSVSGGQGCRVRRKLREACRIR